MHEVLEMGRTYAIATIFGSNESREYDFLVDTGSTHVGLPQVDIDTLRLTAIPNGSMLLRTATGIVQQQTYWAVGEIEGQGFVATVTAAPIPLIGYEFLENRGYRVNPVTETIERVPDDEFAPPFML